MKLRAAALVLALRAAAASDRLRGRERRDLYTSKGPHPGVGRPEPRGGDDGVANILDEDCSSMFSYYYVNYVTCGTDVTVMDERITKDGATGIQLDLSGTVLAAGTKLRLKGADETVDVTAESLASYLNGWSPVVSGDSVDVELVMDDKAAAKGLTSTVNISSFKAEGVCDPQAASICGDTDDRTVSDDQRQGRMGGCTAWLISEDVFIQAGHCGTPSSSTRLHLGVQTSGSAPSDMQFAVAQGTYEGVNGGVGNDWGVGRLLPNNAGQKAGEANGGQWYDIGDVPGGTSDNHIRITGYGVASTQSRWQKTHVGDLVSIQQNSLRYIPDTTGGNSGSPVVHEETGKAIGVHTHGGCSATGGSNIGTRIDRPEFAAKIQAMLGTTPPPTPPLPTAPPTPLPTALPTPPPTTTPPPPPANGVITVDLFQMQFTFTPASACVDAPVGVPAGRSPHQCAQACAVLENCEGFVELGDECFLGAPDDCNDDPNGMFYERGATMYFDN